MPNNSQTYSLENIYIQQLAYFSGNANSGKAGDPIDLKTIFNELVLFHSIDELCNSGYVTITEEGILPLDTPIIGWEKIVIEFSLNIDKGAAGYPNITAYNGKYKRSFIIYAIDNLTENSTKREYIIRFCDASMLINNATRIEKRYKGRAESIIQEIANIQAFKFNKETMAQGGNIINFGKMISTKDNMDFIAPSWKPLNFMAKIASMAKSSAGQFCDCLLYQQVDGNFEFNSYYDIVHSSPTPVLNTPIVDSSSVPPGNSIINYKFDKVFNNQTLVTSGAMGNVTKIFDLTTMKVKTLANYYNYDASHGSFTDKPSGMINSSVVPHGCNPSLSGYNMTANYKTYALNSEQSPVSRFAAKVSPMSSVYMSCCGANRESRLGQNPNDNSGNEPDILRIITDSLGRGSAMKAMSRSTMVTIEFNPTVDLKIGQLINIVYTGSGSGADYVLQGNYFIADLKYVLTISDFRVYATCYSNSISFVNSNRLDGANPNVYHSAQV